MQGGKKKKIVSIQVSGKKQSSGLDTHLWKREVNHGGRSSTAEFKFITNSSLKLSLNVSVNSLKNAERLKKPGVNREISPKLAKKQESS